MIVLDSSFLVAHHNRRDVHHAAAAAAMEPLIAGEWGEILLPEYVFLEVVTVLGARRGIARATSVGELLLDAREVVFVPCSDHFVEAFALFRAQRHFRLSFVDAAIVAVARDRGAEFVATFDDDFRRVDGIGVVPD
ncbi:MAG: type II toxin-antitoxin system VapC family toxin [Gemmatimonadota bacterium]